MVSGLGASVGASRGLFDHNDTKPASTHGDGLAGSSLTSSQNLNDALVLQLKNEAQRAKREAEEARERVTQGTKRGGKRKSP